MEYFKLSMKQRKGNIPLPNIFPFKRRRVDKDVYIIRICSVGTSKKLKGFFYSVQILLEKEKQGDDDIKFNTFIQEECAPSS